MINDLKLIKKHYGEKMMHLCRELFSTLLETPGLLYSLMEKSFAPNHYLYDDIICENKLEEFKNYIYGLLKVSKEEITVMKNPKELMDEAGYRLYECKNERDIQKFRKYYADGEELCTFRGGRLDRCHVFFAVKKNVDEIKRKDYKNPKREDEYGTSVISVQFTRGRVNTLSIKNRYNHMVSNPDATFLNNLDNIVPGLTASFEYHYGLNINSNYGTNFILPGYVLAKDGRYYKYNYEIANIYYCPGNIIIDHFEVVRDYQEKEKYIIIDYFIIDLEKKEVRLHDENIDDSFIDGFKDIKNIQIIKSRENGNRYIKLIPNIGSEIIIEIDKFNRIVSYKNDNLVEVKNGFLCQNSSLMNIDLPNLRKIGNCFLYWAANLKKLNLPSLEVVGDYLCYHNFYLEDLHLDRLRIVGHCFFNYNKKLKEVNLPSLETIGDNFLCFNEMAISVNMPKVIKIGSNFLSHNTRMLKMLYLPSLKKVDYNFLANNNSLRKLNLPNLEIVDDTFLYRNKKLNSVNLPNLEMVGFSFLSSSRKRRKILKRIR